MQQADLLTFLENGLGQLDFDGDLDLGWQKKERTFSIDLIFYAQNNDHQEITDSEGVLSNEEIITFVDSILIYDEQKFDPSMVQQDYLICLPFAGKQGWSLAYGQAFLTYLQIILDNGQSDLLDFLNNSEAEIFELEWSKDEFAKILAAEEKQLQNQRLLYPKF